MIDNSNSNENSFYSNKIDRSQINPNNVSFSNLEIQRCFKKVFQTKLNQTKKKKFRENSFNSQRESLSPSNEIFSILRPKHSIDNDFEDKFCFFSRFHNLIKKNKNNSSIYSSFSKLDNIFSIDNGSFIKEEKKNTKVKNSEDQSNTLDKEEEKNNNQKNLFPDISRISSVKTKKKINLESKENFKYVISSKEFPSCTKKSNFKKKYPYINFYSLAKLFHRSKIKNNSCNNVKIVNIFDDNKNNLPNINNINILRLKTINMYEENKSYFKNKIRLFHNKKNNKKMIDIKKSFVSASLKHLNINDK